MKECAFCFQPAKLSGEHVYSDWMNEVLPGGWESRFTKSADSSSASRYSAELDWKVKVVCEACNNGWMSDIEAKHAKPVMAPLIAGNIGISITQANAQSIAIFAFKTAVIMDLVRKDKDREPFFSRRLRTAFRKHLDIPSIVRMWMCAYAPGARRADAFAGYYSGEMPFVGPVQLCVCTYGVGGFAFQVVAVKHLGSGGLIPAGEFDKLSIPFWPEIPPRFVWPLPFGLRSVQEFIQYHRRWEFSISYA